MTSKLLFRAGAIALGILISTAGVGLSQPAGRGGAGAGAATAGAPPAGRGGAAPAAGRGGGRGPQVDPNAVASPPLGYPSTPSGPILNLKQGRIQGFQRGDVLSFVGIPYAPPPVGDLRWKAPGAPPKWTGVRQAVKPGPDCGTPNPHEDCLYLNVYTGADFKPGDKRAVMVWIHGGSFTGGSGVGGYGVTHDGLDFAKRGIVLITINYRLGRAGWFSDPAINAEPGLHNNYGLMDMIATLKWARDNATSFGGNPNNVTIFGESAGGGSIYQLMRTKESKGLFHKAIAESAFPRSNPTRLAASLAYGESLERANNITGAPAERAAALRRLPLSALNGGQGPNPYPIDDGVLIMPTHAVDGFKNKDEHMVPFMVGGNSADVLGGNFTAAAFDAMTDRKDAFVAAYDPNRQMNKPLMMSQRTTDSGNTEPNYSLALNHANNGQPTFLYFFDYLPVSDRVNPTIYGAKHGAEIQYVFNTMTTDAGGVSTAQAMNAYWAAFAKYGDPGAAGGVLWPKMDARDETAMVFSAIGPHAEKHWLKARIDWTLAGLNAPPAGRGGGRGGAPGRGG